METGFPVQDPWALHLHDLEAPARDLLHAFATYKAVSPAEIAQGFVLEGLSAIAERVRTPEQVARDIERFGHVWAAEQFIHDLRERCSLHPGDIDDAALARLSELSLILHQVIEANSKAKAIQKAESREIIAEVLHPAFLDMRTINLLKSHGIDYLDELLAFSEVGLMKLPGIGKNTIRQIKDCLAALDLSLQGIR